MSKPVTKVPIERVKFKYQSRYAHECEHCGKLSVNVFEPILKGWRRPIFACCWAHARFIERKQRVEKEQPA